MNPVGIAKAARRLELAKGHLDNLQVLANGIDVLKFQEEWYDFLIDLDSVQEILRTSSRKTPQSRQWYGRLQKQFLTDPLLKYLHHARGCEFHGVGVATNLETTPNKYLGFDDNAGLETVLIDQNGKKSSSEAEEPSYWKETPHPFHSRTAYSRSRMKFTELFSSRQKSI